MPSLKTTLDKLKSTITQTQSSKINQKLDKAVRDIVSYKSNSGRNGYVNMMRHLISKTADVKISGVGGGLFSQGVSPTAFGQGSRIARYKAYQAIVSQINYAIRALNVLVDNILSPDDITKQTLEIRAQQFMPDDTAVSSKVRYVKEVINTIDLERKLDVIVRNTLLYGDLFCELGGPKAALTSQTLLSESNIYQQTIDEQYKNGTRERIIQEVGGKQVEINLDFTAFDEATTKPSKSQEKKKKKILKNLNLIFHNPQFIVKLQSSLFPICFGYLSFPIRSVMPATTMADDAINNICIAILKSLAKKLPQMKEFSNNEEIKDIIKTLLAQTDLNRSMDIRYIPPDKMIHFMVPTTKFYPYGESIFDSTQYTAKVLISLETALAVQRLSRSTEKRKIGIEIGLPRDARKAVELMKEEFRKRKISLDSFGSVDTIPSLISTFEDVYIPQKDGKPFVDISTFTEGNVDVRSKVDELKFMRDSLVASLGIPPSFCGIEENLSNKCLDLLTKIKLLSGKNIRLLDLINEFNETGTLTDKYTYSYDKETGRITPGKIVWAGITRKNAKVVKVTLDNGKYEIVTPDHHYMLRNGEYIEAQYLNSGDSLMPLYSKLTHIKTTNKRIPYQLVYHPGEDAWQETHRMVAIHERLVEDGDKLNVHHIDFNPLNNFPSNLEGLSNKDHLNKHIQHKHFITTGRGKVKKENYITENCVICNEEYTRHIQTNQVTCLSSECIQEVRRINGKKSFEKRKKYCAPKILLVCPFCEKEFYRAQKYIDDRKSGIITCGDKECYRKSFIQYNNTEERKEVARKAGRKAGNKSKDKLVAYNKKHGAPMKGRTKETHPEIFERRTKTLRENRKRKGLNHKVVSVEFLDYTIDTGDITVEKYHNFAVSSGVIVSNSALTEENILFARTVIGHQKYLTHQLRELIQKVFDIIDPEEALSILDHVEISLPIPRSLQYEREARYMNEVSNLIENLERIGIPKEYTKKKYLSQIDWEEVKKYGVDEKLDKELDPSKKSEEEGGLGGMGGMGGLGGAGGFGGGI